MSINMKYLQSVAGVLTRNYLDLGARLIVHVVGLALFFDENSVKIRDISTSCILVMTFIPAILQIKQNEAKHPQEEPLEIPTVNYYLPTGYVCSVDARFFGAVQYHLSDRADDC